MLLVRVLLAPLLVLLVIQVLLLMVLVVDLPNLQRRRKGSCECLSHYKGMALLKVIARERVPRDGSKYPPLPYTPAMGDYMRDLLRRHHCHATPTARHDRASSTLLQIVRACK